MTLSTPWTVRGLVVRDASGMLSLLTPEGTVTELPKAQIKSSLKEKTSIMTETLADTLGREQLRNLAAFLTSAPATR